MKPFDQYRQNFSPLEVQPLIVTEWTTSDLVLLWLSGFVCGSVGVLIYFGG